MVAPLCKAVHITLGVVRFGGRSNNKIHGLESSHLLAKSLFPLL